MECLIRSPSTTNTTNNNIIINMRVPQAPRSTVALCDVGNQCMGMSSLVFAS